MIHQLPPVSHIDAPTHGKAMSRTRQTSFSFLLLLLVLKDILQLNLEGITCVHTGNLHPHFWGGDKGKKWPRKKESSNLTTQPMLLSPFLSFIAFHLQYNFIGSTVKMKQTFLLPTSLTLAQQEMVWIRISPHPVLVFQLSSQLLLHGRAF